VYMADAQQNPLRQGWLCIPGFITWSDTKPEEQSSDVPAVAEYTLGMTHQEKDTPPASMFLQNRCPLVPVSHGGLTYLRYKWDTSQNPDFPRNIGGKNAMGFGYRTVDKSVEIQGLGRHAFPFVLFFVNKNQTGRKYIHSIFHPMALTKVSGTDIMSLPRHTIKDEKYKNAIFLSMLSDSWWGPSTSILHFPQEDISPLQAQQAEKEGTITSLLPMDLRFRSYWGVYHHVTHFSNTLGRFRVLTGRLKNGHLEDRFSSTWNAEDVVYWLFRDRFTPYTHTSGTEYVGSPERSIPDVQHNAPVFDFLAFCQKHGVHHVLDKKPVDRVSGIRESRPLFMLLAGTYGQYTSLDAYDPTYTPNIRTGMEIFNKMSSYAHFNVKWTEVRPCASKTKVSIERKKKYEASHTEQKKENIFSTIRTLQELYPALISNEKGTEITRQILTGTLTCPVPYTALFHIFSDDIFPRANKILLQPFPLYNRYTHSLKPRPETLRGIPLLHFQTPTLWYFLAEHTSMGSSLKKNQKLRLLQSILPHMQEPIDSQEFLFAFHNWLTLQDISLPESVPLPKEYIHPHDIDPDDPLGCLNTYVPYVTLLSMTATRIQRAINMVSLQNRLYHSASSSQALPFVIGNEKQEDIKKLQSFFTTHLMKTSPHCTLHDTYTWLGGFLRMLSSCDFLREDKEARQIMNHIFSPLVSTLEAQSGILATRKHEQEGEDIGMDLDIF
jgi:hypothetical protein